MSAPRERSDGDWYADPLYYDIIFDQDSVDETDFIEAMHRRHGNGTSKSLNVLEPACGSGRLMVELAKRGHRVTGFDLEPAMLEFSGRRLVEAGVQGSLHRGKMQRFEIPGRFDLAHSVCVPF